MILERETSMAPSSIVKNEKGFSLVEMIVVTAIFVAILVITGQTFETIVAKTTQETKTAETQIEGAVGLEILRRDLAQAGYGLPWDLDGATYSEVTAGTGALVPGVDPTDFNDGPPNAPRAVVSSDTTASTIGFNGSDILVVKSTITGLNETAKKWYTATFTHYTSNQMETGERLVVLRNAYSGGALMKKVLLKDSTGKFTVSYPAANGTFPADFRPEAGLDTYMVYGVAPADSTGLLRTPFNRSDYYIKRPDLARSIPETCAKQVEDSDTEGVGILYRSTASQVAGASGGGFSPPYPLLDCVADMQVVYSLDSNGDGAVDLHSDVPLANAEAVRAQVKEVRVYILAQEGSRSSGFNSPHSQILVGERINGVDYGRSFVFADHNIRDWANYRWRLYTIVVPLGNLN